MQPHPTPAPFDPEADAEAAIQAALERANAGWTAEHVEADAVASGFTPAQAAELVDHAWRWSL